MNYSETKQETKIKTNSIYFIIIKMIINIPKIMSLFNNNQNYEKEESNYKGFSLFNNTHKQNNLNNLFVIKNDNKNKK